MKTERLYYDDPYLLEFDASVVEKRSVDGRCGIILDKTAFYPTSGGQPNDLGTINGSPLIDCFEDQASGAVVHILESAIDSQTVHCRIDGDRRRDHMQQHSGQHVLSQAFVELFNWPTVSFHLGVVHCTVDLATESVSHEQLDAVERLANKIIRANRGVAVRYVSEGQAASSGLRKPSERTGEIRIIDIDGFDRSACGGTHVRSTGEIGPILITGLERIKRQARVQFICGDRVLHHAHLSDSALESISQTVSAPPLETPAAVRTLWNDHQQACKRVEDMEFQLMDFEAAQFSAIDGFAIGCFKNRGVEKLKLLASKICSQPGKLALLADQGDQLRVVFARSADVNADVAALLKQTLERFGGRGGGRPHIVQGGGLNGDPEEILRFAKDLAGRE
jgi:alanyl-tRNA synthetase